MEATFQLVCLGITRISAFFMYPGKCNVHTPPSVEKNLELITQHAVLALVLVFLTKFRATTSFFSRTPLSMFMIGNVHELHRYCGWTILIDGTLHSVLHLALWGQQRNMYLLFHHRTGISGFAILVSMILIIIPMAIFRARIKYEIRKNLHYFFLFFAMALAFHVPPSAIPNGGFAPYIFGVLLVWYFLDATFFMTEKIETTRFHALPNGVQMHYHAGFRMIFSERGDCPITCTWFESVKAIRWIPTSIGAIPVMSY
jgi:hypothetical protein